MDFAAEFLVSETGFVESARGGADEVVAQERVKPETGKGFLSEEDFGSGLVLDPFQDLAVATKEGLIEDIRGCVESAALEGGEEGGDIASIEAGFGVVGHLGKGFRLSGVELLRRSGKNR